MSLLHALMRWARTDLARARLASLLLALLWGAGSAGAAPGDHRHDHPSANPQVHKRALRHHHSADSPEALAQRLAQLAQAETLLTQGDAAGALRGFERAAQSAHQADIELGILRAQMQLGDYRHALAFAAHTAGVHADEVDGRVFYAWLLYLGSQGPMAELTLRQAEATASTHPLVRAVRQHWQAGGPPTTSAMRQTPARLAPHAWGEPVPASARVVASGTLLADGRHALVPRSAWQGDRSTAVWLRNGMGQTVRAHWVDEDTALGQVLLHTDGPLPVVGDELLPPRDAFAGSPLYALTHAVDPAPSALLPPDTAAPPNTGAPAWPLMRAGFLGRDTLGVDWPVSPPSAHGPGQAGGPVMDAGGRLIGVSRRVAEPGRPAFDRLVPVHALVQRFGQRPGLRFGHIDAQARTTPSGADTAYERGLRLTLQLLRADAP